MRDGTQEHMCLQFHLLFSRVLSCLYVSASDKQYKIVDGI